MTIMLRAATLNDVSIIAKFNTLLAEETENKLLDMDKITAGVAALISDQTKGTYFLACRGKEIVGQLMITYEWSDWRNGNFWWIQSVYVDQAYRQQGVYTQLYRHVERVAKAQKNVCGLRLYVERDNQRAQTTYKNLGMTPTHYHIMENEF